MTTLVIIIELEALIFTGTHGELFQYFLSLFFHIKTIIGRSKQIQNKKWCDGTDKSSVILKDTLIHILETQDSTCWLRLIEFKRAEKCVDLYNVVASIKTERYVNLLLKRQQWTLELKESKLCDARKKNGQRKPMTRDWGPSTRLLKFDLLVMNSQLKRVQRYLAIVFCVWLNIHRKLMEDIAEETIHARALLFCRV